MSELRKKIIAGQPVGDKQNVDTYEYGSATLNRNLDRIKSIEEPKDVAGLISDLMKDRQVGLAEEDEKFYKDKMAEFGKRAETAKQLYEKNRDATEWARLGEIFGHALVKFAAARDGLKSGVDVTTGLRADKSDWERIFDRLQKDLDRELTAVDKGETMMERRRANLLNQATSERDKAAALKIREAGARESQTERQRREQETQAKKAEAVRTDVVKTAQSNISKMSNARDDLIRKVQAAEQKLSEGLISPDKYKTDVMNLIANNYRKSGFEAEVNVEELLKKAEEPGLWDSFVGALPFTDKPDPGIPISQQLLDIPAIQWNEETQEILNNYMRIKPGKQKDDFTMKLREKGIL